MSSGAFKRVVVVAGGKGGVGKTTVATALAMCMKRSGRVGLLDADVSGPSIPTLLGISERPRVDNRRMLPVMAGGVAVFSTGLFGGQDKPFAWRGPLLRGALRQMVRDVDWGELDYLVVDTPPGTGEVHLTLLELLTVDSTVVVTTAQPMAISDTRRCLGFLQNAQLPVAAVVENMAGYRCPSCGALTSPPTDVPGWDSPLFRLPYSASERPWETSDFNASMELICGQLVGALE